MKLFRRFRKLLESSLSVRLTLTYSLLAVVSTLGLVGFIYLQTVGAQQGEMYKQMASRLSYLVSQFEYGGPDAVVGAIDAALSEDLLATHELYLYLDASGQSLAGNFERVLDFPITEVWQPETLVQQGDAEVLARIQSRVLSDGSIVIVGRDMDDLDALRALMGRASAAAILLALFIVAAGTYIFKHELELRVSSIRHTAARISAGQFRQRIPVSDRNDEFSQLARDLNTMLDRVEGLMQGVRHVTDTVAHNLRTPLMRMQANLHMAQQAENAPEALRQANDYAIQELERLTILFDKLLQIAEIEAGTQRRNFTVIEPATIAADVVDLYEPFAQECNITLTLEVHSRRVVLGDADLLASALANVIDNGIKYAKSRVAIQIENAWNHRVAIAVQDDGPGIPEADKNHIGTHFYRVDHEVYGHGLGLASVRAITQLHHGNIRMENHDQGFTFTIELPITRET